jgi:hypothetical protein
MLRSASRTRVGRVQAAGVVDVDGGRGDLEDRVAVLEAQDVLVGPVAEAAVLGQAVAADARAGEDHVAVGRAHLDRVDDLDQVDAVALGEQAPLVQEGQDRRPVGVLDDLGGLRLDRPVHHRQRELLGVEHLAQELLDPLARLGVAAGADAPEVADRGHVVAARHHALEAVASSGVASMPALGERLLQDRPGDELGRARGDRGLDQDQALRLDLLADGAHGRLQGGHVRLAGAHVAEVALECSRTARRRRRSRPARGSRC